MNKAILHGIAGSLAMLCIATFWSSTLIAEIFLSPSAVLAVKHAIAYIGIPLLIVAMAMTGASGTLLGKGRKGRLLNEKKKRMPYIAGNGLLIMIPSAFFLYWKAANAQIDWSFYFVQCIELTVGLVQLTLMGKNFLTGLRLAGKLRQKMVKQ